MDSTYHRLTLRFRDAEIERRFRAAVDAKTVGVTRIGIVAAALLFAVGCLVIVVFTPKALLSMDVVRIWALVGAISGVSAVQYLFTFSAPFRTYPQAAVSALCVAAGLVIAAGLKYLPVDVVANRGFLFLALHVFTVYSLARLRLLPALVGGWGSLALYGLAMWNWQVIDGLSLVRHVFWLTVCNFWGVLICYQLESSLRREFVASLERDLERARAEGLLLNILPGPIAERLKASTERIAEHSDEVTVLFADIVGFTPLASRKTPVELVTLLDQVFSGFDRLAHEHGLEKIKTIGDAYMAVAGLPQPQPDHALRAASMAVAMLGTVRQVAHETGDALQVRVGLHTGPVVAGVIGQSKFSYDLWGDTVNVASRMESSGMPGEVHCTPHTAAFLQGKFLLLPRGAIEVKGKGPMETFFVAAPAAGL